MITIRDATIDDLARIVEIYNASILTTTTWSERFQTLEERTAWFEDRGAADDAVLVADDGRELLGFAAYGEFRDNRLWPGYRFTVENTVHVAGDVQGRGVGRSLMEALIDHAVDAGHHVMVAAVDGANEASIAFHEALGFEVVGRLPQVGRKFDRWLDLVFLQRMLDRDER